VDKIRLNSWTIFGDKDIFRFVTTFSFLSPYIEVEGHKIIMTSKKIFKESKMKAYVKLTLPGFTGNMDDVVIYYNSHLNKYIARKKVIPKYTPSNEIIKEIFAFAKRIELSDGYLNDCREYIFQFNRKNRRQDRAMNTWPNVFMKVMRATMKSYPDLDLKTLTREEIIAMNLPFRSIYESINAGYLEKVRDYNKLVNII